MLRNGHQPTKVFHIQADLEKNRFDEQQRQEHGQKKDYVKV